ncbi:MAG: hypothetical protein ACLQBC_18165 [Syntrophales bacterium]
MAIGWEKVQKNGKKFWKYIYVEKSKDVTPYMPVTDDAALAFSKKSVELFGHGMNIMW